MIRSEPHHFPPPIELPHLSVQGVSEGIYCWSLERQQALESGLPTWLWMGGVLFALALGAFSGRACAREPEGGGLSEHAAS
jgi:hypothetical protein